MNAILKVEQMFTRESAASLVIEPCTLAFGEPQYFVYREGHYLGRARVTDIALMLGEEWKPA